MKRRFLAAAFVGFLSVGLSGTLLAVTRTVTSAADQGEGSLREAWFASASGDVIEVQEGLEILLESEMSVTNKTLTVRGLGSGATVNGQGKTAMFYLRSTWGRNPSCALKTSLSQTGIQRRAACSRLMVAVHRGRTSTNWTTVGSLEMPRVAAVA